MYILHSYIFSIIKPRIFDFDFFGAAAGLAVLAALPQSSSHFLPRSHDLGLKGPVTKCPPISSTCELTNGHTGIRTIQ